jgi:hypothetical protein
MNTVEEENLLIKWFLLRIRTVSNPKVEVVWEKSIKIYLETQPTKNMKP